MFHRFASSLIKKSISMKTLKTINFLLALSLFGFTASANAQNNNQLNQKEMNTENIFDYIKNGKFIKVSKMVGNGADLTVTDADGKTPLILAAELGKYAMISIFLEKNAEINAKDSSGKTALMYACENGHSKVVQVLINKGKADKSLTDNSAKTALDYAKENGDSKTLKVIEKV